MLCLESCLLIQCRRGVASRATSPFSTQLNLSYTHLGVPSMHYTGAVSAVPMAMHACTAAVCTHLGVLGMCYPGTVPIVMRACTAVGCTHPGVLGMCYSGAVPMALHACVAASSTHPGVLGICTTRALCPSPCMHAQQLYPPRGAIQVAMPYKGPACRSWSGWTSTTF